MMKTGRVCTGGKCCQTQLGWKEEMAKAGEADLAVVGGEMDLLEGEGGITCDYF